MRTLLKIIDAISEYTGQTVLWLAVALVLVLAFETTARYAFGRPTVWVYETSYMIGATMVVLGWSYVHKHHGHIRVDVFYTRLSPRGRAIIDVVCSLVFLFPLLSILIYSANSSMLFAWKMNEKLPESTWMPPAAPIRAAVLVGISLFSLQCIAQFIRDLYSLVRNKAYD